MLPGKTAPEMEQRSSPDPLAQQRFDALGRLVALLMGVAAFQLMLGWQVLLPSNIGWLNFADRAMHTLGWMFYRDAPWGMPPGRSPHLGIELSSSIGLVDGLPLFAMPLKLIAAWLPRPFQYWGGWFLLSFSLQSYFAYRIARELGAGVLLALLAAGFALITPAFMFRVTMHMALSGHFLVLAALLLYVQRTPPRAWQWPLLVALTAAVHAYLLVMVVGLWVAALVERLWSRCMHVPSALRETAFGLAAAVLVLWTAGFFVTPSVGTYGYGAYKLNLAWPFLSYGWSQLFPDLPHTKYDYEGLSFPGIGILGLLLLAIVSGAIGEIGHLFRRRWVPLLVAIAGMMVFAWSKTPAWFESTLADLTVPAPLDFLGSTLRSTGRFVWPLLYVSTIGTVVLLARRWALLVAVPIVALAFALQAWDTAPHLLRFAQTRGEPSSVWTTSLVSPFWERAAAAGYRRIRAIPIRDPGPGQDWQEMGYFAVTHDLEIDTVYLGRQDAAGVAYLRQRAEAALATGDFDTGTIYLLDQPSAHAAMRVVHPNDLLTIIDKRIVFARDGAGLVALLGISPQMPF